MEKWWKKLERRVANYFGAQRNSLSGGNSKVSRSDTTHDVLYIEVKGRKTFSTVTLWRDTKEKAMKEGKIPVVVLAEKGMPGFWILAHKEHLKTIAKEVLNEEGGP